MENKKICPETVLRVLLRAEDIPDKSEVAKRTGEEVYTLTHNLKVWQDDQRRKAGEEPLEINGFFLIGSRGSVNQVNGDKLLHWIVTAEDFIDTIKQSWETEQ